MKEKHCAVMAERGHKIDHEVVNLTVESMHLLSIFFG